MRENLVCYVPDAVVHDRIVEHPAVYEVEFRVHCVEENDDDSDNHCH